MATLTVGTGQQYSTIAAAVAASRDGDVIAVQAGTYVNDFATINTKVTLKAVGGMVTLQATVAPPNGKAILVTRNDITIDGFELTGAKVPSGNGAGIRFEGGHLTILNSWFHHNENGLLSGGWPDSHITIRNSEFSHNGTGDGRTHNLYVGEITTLTIENSYFHDAVVGHEIKSRAFATTIRDSRIQNQDGNGSYEVDLPNGGKAVLTGNVIEQGARSQNPAIVHFGGEAGPHPGSSLEMSGNTIINKLASPSQRALLNHTDITATISGTSVFGLTAAQMSNGPATVTGTTFLSAAPPLDTSSPWKAGTTPPPGLPVGTSGPDEIALAAAVDGVEIDLGSGADRLTLSSAGPNRLTVKNIETVIGGAAADQVTFGTAVQGGLVDLGGGADRLTLSSAGPNSLTVRNVETVLGGFRADEVTLGSPVDGVQVNLGSGADRLVLSSAGPNRVVVRNVETITGGAAADEVRFGAVANGALVELGAGADRVILSSAGPNAVTVSGVETVQGGSSDDRITATGDQAVVMSGGGGADTLTGAAGNDRLDGGAGADVLIGGAGDDRLIGGEGVDVMTGGAGADRFVWRAVSESPVAAPDRVTDFQAGQDKLVFIGLLQGSFAWRGTAEFVAGGNSQARLSGTTLLVDVNGDRTADMAVDLSGGSLGGLAARDFIWS